MTTFQLLLYKIKNAYQNKLPFVAYKLPNQKQIKAIFQKNNKLHFVDDYTETGFVFAPFKNKKTILIRDEIIVKAIFEISKIANKTPKEIQETFKTKEKYLKFVKKTISFLEEEKVSKIVIARTKTIQVSDFDFIYSFQKLLEYYDSEKVYVWYHPKIGMWLGATPEILLKIENKYLKTTSLAGTKEYLKTKPVKWGKKEIEEQQLVTDYIVENLKPLLTKLKISKIHTVKTGNLLHLRTDIEGVMIEEKLKDLISAIHPTPAVCGLPKKKAKEYILKNENFERKYYTGFLGEINKNKKTNLFVNLRCMEVTKTNEIKIYIGGGITKKSIPKNEWEETIAKSKVIEKVL